MTPAAMRTVLPLFCFGIVATAPLRAQITRDSAGIRLIENARQAWESARAWQIGRAPVLDLGEQNGDSLYEFANIRGVVRLGDGRIAVANGATGTIRFFDARGKYLSSFGRKGAGPGEFRDIVGIARIRGDSLVVLNMPAPPVSIANYFDSGGRFSRATTIFGDGRSIISPSFLADGSVAGFALDVNRGDRRRARTTRWVDSIPVVRLNLAARVDTLARIPYSENHATSSSPSGKSSLAFAAHAAVAAATDGIYAGFPSQYAIGYYSPAGTLQRIIRRPATPRPLPAHAPAAYRAWYARRNVIPPVVQGDARKQMEAMRAQYLKDLAFAPVLPEYRDLIVDRTAHLWAQRYELQHGMPECSGFMCVPTFNAPSTWDVFDPAGRWLGGVALPGGFAPTDIGSDYVLGLWRDGDDVEHVRMYALQR